MIEIVNANSLHIPLADKTIQCAVTSPPYYGLRDYGVAGQIGLEETPEAYVEKLVAVFREVRRVLKDDGVLWLNIGDSYAGSGGAGGDYNAGGLKEGQPRYKSNFKIDKSKREAKRWGGGNIPATGDLKPKDLIGIPWLVAFALRADGWYLRSDIIWNKPNPMPESVTDRPTRSHEYIFLLSKSARYFYDAEAIREPAKDSSVARLSQDVENQEGSDRANGGAKTNGKMKAVKFGGNKAEGYGSRLYSGNEWKPTTTHKNLADDGRRPRTMHVDRANGKGEIETITANKKSVWTVSTKPYSGAHFATFPPDLIEPCILAGSRPADIVMDPFSGTATVGVVCAQKQRRYIGLELNPAYIQLAKERVNETQIEMMI